MAPALVRSIHTSTPMVQMTAQVPSHLARAVEHLARQERMSTSQFVATLLAECVELATDSIEGIEDGNDGDDD